MNPQVISDCAFDLALFPEPGANFGHAATGNLCVLLNHSPDESDLTGSLTLYAGHFSFQSFWHQHPLR
jgi:hypothetical protein